MGGGGRGRKEREREKNTAPELTPHPPPPGPYSHPLGLLHTVPLQKVAVSHTDTFSAVISTRQALTRAWAPASPRGAQWITHFTLCHWKKQNKTRHLVRKRPRTPRKPSSELFRVASALTPTSHWFHLSTHPTLRVLSPPRPPVLALSPLSHHSLFEADYT